MRQTTGTRKSPGEKIVKDINSVPVLGQDTARHGRTRHPRHFAVDQQFMVGNRGHFNLRRMSVAWAYKYIDIRPAGSVRRN